MCARAQTCACRLVCRHVEAVTARKKEGPKKRRFRRPVIIVTTTIAAAAAAAITSTSIIMIMYVYDHYEYRSKKRCGLITTKVWLKVAAYGGLSLW